MTLYRYSWRNGEKRATLYNRICVVYKRLSFNSRVVVFVDSGQTECVSGNALRRAGVQSVASTLGLK